MDKPKTRFLDLDRRFFKYLWPFRARLALTLICMAGAALMDIASPWPLKYIVDNLIGKKPFQDLFGRSISSLFNNDAYHLAIFFGALIIVFAFFGGLLTFTYGYLQGVIQERTTFALRNEVFAHLQSLSLSFHDQSRSGELIGRVTRDASNVMDALVHTTGEVILNLLDFIGIAAVMFFVNWRFSIIALAFAPLLFFLFSLFRKKIKASAEAERSEDGQILNVTHETISAIRIVKAFGREKDEQRRFEQHGAARLNAGIRLALWESSFEPIIDLVKAVGVATVVLYGTFRIFSGTLTVGELLIFISYLGVFYNPLKRFSKLAGMLQTGAVGGERLSQLLDIQQKIKDSPDAIGIAQLNGQVEFRNVSFSYNDSGPTTLLDVSFNVKAGQKIAIVGTTGAGKSTLASLLMRFYDPDIGKVLLDGMDIKKIKLSSLKQQFALVPQEPLLFATSVRDNIAYGRPEASKMSVIEAAVAANAHGFISKLPNGYETIVGERGASLSIGQRQRIAIARAILQNAPILILDEPTAALDSVTEAEVMGALGRLMEKRTTFIIAHRLSTIQNADLIFVIENGQLVESGRHAELMEIDGYYSKFVHQQNAPVDHLAITQPILKNQPDVAHQANAIQEPGFARPNLERGFRWILANESNEHEEEPEHYSTSEIGSLLKKIKSDYVSDPNPGSR